MKLSENKIENISVNQVVPNKINPNKMPAPTFEKLKLSLTQFGQLNPIIVRKIPTVIGSHESVFASIYEIIDGEWRWTAAKALGWSEIQAKIIEATEEEVAKLIFASTIKGKHDVYESSDLIEQLAKTETSSSLKAMNLDKGKIERKTKYHGSKKIVIVKRKEKNRDEKDSGNVKPVDKYKKIILLSEAPKYCTIENGKVVLK